MKRVLSLLLSLVIAFTTFACVNVAAADAGDESVNVAFKTAPTYTGEQIVPDFDVCFGNKILNEGSDYDVTFSNNTSAGSNAEVNIIGKGAYSSFSKTEKFTILRRNINEATVSDIPEQYFSGSAVKPLPKVSYNGKDLVKDKDYVLQHINNTSAGAATVRIIGIGNFCGHIEKNYNIALKDLSNIGSFWMKLTLNKDDSSGKIYEQTVGMLTEIETYQNENIVSASITLRFNTDPSLLNETHRIDPATTSAILFTPKYAGVYEVRMTYTIESSHSVCTQEFVNGVWKTVCRTESESSTHTRYCTIIAYSNEPANLEGLVAETPVVNELKQSYLSVKATTLNADLRDVKWKSSDESVATVENGIVTYHKAGKATITAQSGAHKATWKMENAPLNIASNSKLYNYNPTTGDADLVYKGEVLTKGVDYTVNKEVYNGVSRLDVSGCNLFGGEFCESYYVDTNCPFLCNHENITESFTQEPTCTQAGQKKCLCNSCGYSRFEVAEAMGHDFSSEWTIDVPATCTAEGSKSHHCTRCDSKTDITVIPVDPTNHTVGDWKTDKKATVNAAGKKHKECTECGKTVETAKIPQLKCSKPKLSKIENTADGVKITWGKVSGADKYDVYRKTGSGKYSKIGTTSKTYYTDKKASSGKKYYYYVKAVNEAGASSASSSKSILYLADTTLSTPKSTKSGITLKWSKITGADGYMVYRKTGSGSYSKIATVKGNSKVAYTDKSAKKGKTYTYKIKAYKSKTYSAYSNTKKIKDKY